MRLVYIYWHVQAQLSEKIKTVRNVIIYFLKHMQVTALGKTHGKLEADLLMMVITREQNNRNFFVCYVNVL